jgi:tetratricopeptide (TPR) repeat protein
MEMTVAKQDEKQRLRRRLQDQAIELAATNKWDDALEINKQIIGLGEDAEAYNRMGKALLELGRFADARDAYQNALRFNPTNTIARKNLARLEQWFSQGAEDVISIKQARQQVDLRLFITETGKTALTTLVDVPRNAATAALVTGEKMELRVEGRSVVVIDADGNAIGRLEPKLSQRLSEMIDGGNRYVAAIAQADPRQVRLLIRETYQDPSQRGRISFPGKLSESALRSYVPNVRYDYEGEDLLEDEETSDDREEIEEDFGGNDEEELGLDDIEPDIGDDDENSEE